MGDGSELTGPWVGLSGRSYQRAPDQPDRQGVFHRVLPVVPVGEGGRTTDPPAGRRLGLLLPAHRGQAARAAVGRELDALEKLSAGAAASPGPRLYDRVEGELPAGVVDWCAENLEEWWAQVVAQPEGYRNLCLAMADICRRTADWAAAARKDPDLERLAPRVRPRSVLRTVGGRWVLSGFGADPSPVLDEADASGGTEVMTATSHFQPPEELFHATTEHPLASATWAIGTTFFTLLKMRAYLVADGSARRPELPAGGTDSPHMGSHRSALVEDLLRRKPALFADRPLDPRQFLYPDRLPDRDRRTVADAMLGLLGPEQGLAEAQLARECLKLLDSALSVDPARRYLDPMVMAGDFEGLARRFRAARSSVAAARLAPPEEAEPASLRDEPTQEELLPGVGPPGESEAEEPAADAPTAPPDGLDLVADGPPPTRAAAAPAAAAALDPLAADDDEPLYVVRTPAWVKGALVGLALGQVLTLALVGLLWVRDGGTTSAPPPPTPAPASMLDEVLAPAAVPPPVAAPEPPPVEPEQDSGGQDEPLAPDGTDLPAAEPPVEPEPPPEAASPPPPPARPGPETAAAAPTSAARASNTSAPRPEPEPAPAEDGGKGSVSVIGATAQLRGAAGLLNPGQVPAGTYTVLVKEGEAWVEACTATVTAGQQAVVRCGFGQCRQVQ